MTKHQNDSIVYGVADKEYKRLKFAKSITEMLNSEIGTEILKKSIQKIITELNPGEKILNTNLPSEFLVYKRIQVKKPQVLREDDIEKRPRPGRR